MRTLFLAAAAAALLTIACSEGQAQEGPETSRTFPVTDFAAIAVSGPFDVMVSTGKAPSVRAVGSQRLIDALEVVVEDGRLTIRSRNKDWYKGGAWRRGNARVAVTVPQLAKAALAGSGNVTIDRISGREFNGTVAGSGDLRLNDVAVDKLVLSVAGSGDINAAGRAGEARYSIAGSGGLDSGGLVATVADASVAGSGNIRARVTGRANASVSGSGNIDISGGAQCRQSRQGSGNIRCA